EHNELYFGTDNLFFTLESLVEPSVRNNGELTRVGWSYAVIGLSALVLMDLVLRRRFKGWLMTSVLLLGGVLTGAILERSLFDAFYAIERAALYLVPLFGLVFFFA